MPKVTTILKVWHTPVHEREPEKEAPSLRDCFKFLDQTSRSFSSVIKELHPELLVPICLFYLVLRGLDTIEDDMTIKLEEKEPLLRDFDKILEKDGWSYDGNGPDEKDRQLLVDFNCVVQEFKKIKQPYKIIIKDIAYKMGNGMADFANNAEHNLNGVDTVEDYELYCHYVAGLVGEGLTRLFVESGMANSQLLHREDLHEAMGQFLQQTNIIRDIREDFDEKRKFYPKEVWSKHVDNFEDLFKPENKEAALNCSSEMVLIALRKAPDCLFYLAGIRDQSVFNFAAIPQSMAIATLALCFRNPNMFKRNIKITRGEACQLMTESTQNLRMVCDVFRRFARKIHKKNTPKDPNFLNISIACGKIEKFIESIFPSQDPRAIVAGSGASGKSPEQLEKEAAEWQEAKWDVIYMGLAVFCTLAVISALMLGLAWYLGARFDVAIDQLKQGNLKPPPGDSPDKQNILSQYDGHQEL
ncbi:MAG: bifunctional farnesyl-diphosphate farnesyltransferase/squalene synthase [Bogoriella megaspora]|nr:MAG: bifunctional farnesyl-diphosphate farnesyltransferase/squalene synthase [Bogoriella megaspora]